MEGGLLVHVPGPRRAGAVEIDTLAREAGLHPDVVRGLVALGLLEPAPFPRDAAARLARAGGLRRDLGLNYAGAVLACELLARIDESSPACDERHLDD
jgi:chaperone modulatory protein CbpM